MLILLLFVFCFVLIFFCGSLDQGINTKLSWQFPFCFHFYSHIIIEALKEMVPLAVGPLFICDQIFLVNMSNDCIGYARFHNLARNTKAISGCSCSCHLRHLSCTPESGELSSNRWGFLRGKHRMRLDLWLEVTWNVFLTTTQENDLIYTTWVFSITKPTISTSERFNWTANLQVIM